MVNRALCSAIEPRADSVSCWGECTVVETFGAVRSGRPRRNQVVKFVAIPGFELRAIGPHARQSKRGSIRGENLRFYYTKAGHAPLSGPCSTVATAYKAAGRALERLAREARRAANV